MKEDYPRCAIHMDLRMSRYEVQVDDRSVAVCTSYKAAYAVVMLYDPNFSSGVM